MKTLLLVPLLLVYNAFADEPADRNTISGVILQLNRVPQPDGLFADGADAAVLDRLWAGKLRQVRVVEQPAAGGVLSVTISHEPWGEARIGPTVPKVEVLNPHISLTAIRFVTTEVALADGVFSYTPPAGAAQATALLFVVKREGQVWKIAVVRVVIP